MTGEWQEAANEDGYMPQEIEKVRPGSYTVQADSIKIDWKRLSFSPEDQFRQYEI